MKVLTLNCGSSSVKYSLWGMPARRKICSGIAERVKIGKSFIRYRAEGQEEFILHKECPNHGTAIKLTVDLLTSKERGVMKDVSTISAVGHRVVHGGEEFKQSVIINDEVVKAIERYSMLAPLHNPANLLGIRAAMELMPNIPHIAVFDTAFLATVPKHAHIYAVPYDWYEKYQIRRYGFHGTSHLYVSKRAAALLRKKSSEINAITLHIGNGVSVTAVKKGVAYDHSMGFTPLEGAVMGTRSGDIDPAIPLYVMQKEGLTADQMESILNKKSGLLGITGKYIDRRDIVKAASQGDERARLAIKIECYRLRKYIGAYAAALGGLDTIVFTAGVGENAPLYRAKICEGLEFLGVKIDPKKNEQALGKEMDISSPDSRVKVLVIPTNEELVMAEDVLSLLEGRYDVHTKFKYPFEKPDFVPP